jgi:UDP-N-acetylmuramoylalanine--D-glutamate ligase
VILGGDGKGQSFAPLANAVRAHARAAVLIGKDGPAIGAALEGTSVPLMPAADLTAAVQAAAQVAQQGDIVLLSPACASFDAFRNYAHRAEVFIAAVRELAANQNQQAGAP